MAAPIRTTPDAPTCGNIRTARFCRCCARPGSAASPRPPSACGFPHGFRGAPACRRGSTCFPRRWRASRRRAARWRSASRAPSVSSRSWWSRKSVSPWRPRVGRSGAPANLLATIDRLPRHGARDAYRFRDGVRWRARTYATLHARTLACAGLLARSGLKPGGTVLIQGPDHPDWVEALLGTLRAGGVAVPLDAGTPPELRAKVARLSEARLLLAPPGFDPPDGCRRIDFGAWGVFTVPRVLDLLAAEVRRLLREQGALESIESRQRRFGHWPLALQLFLFRRVQRLFGWRFRFIVSGGAALPEEVQQFWQSLGILVAQGYGLTETAPIVTLANPFERRTGVVGRPLGGQEVRLGPDGEGLVRGRNVTPGYLGAAETSGEWLHTGDVGELDAEGRLRIRGRLKDVIVTPEGENVHPTDVEAAFQGIAGVREISVLGLPSSGGERVHAVLLLDKGSDAEEMVRRANETLLPRQRVRDFTVWPAEDLPRTATGKVRKGIVRDRILTMQQGGAGAPAHPAGSGSVRRLLALVARLPPEPLPAPT